YSVRSPVTTAHIAQRHAMKLAGDVTKLTTELNRQPPQHRTRDDLFNGVMKRPANLLPVEFRVFEQGAGARGRGKCFGFIRRRVEGKGHKVAPPFPLLLPFSPYRIAVFVPFADGPPIGQVLVVLRETLAAPVGLQI